MGAAATSATMSTSSKGDGNNVPTQSGDSADVNMVVFDDVDENHNSNTNDDHRKPAAKNKNASSIGAAAAAALSPDSQHDDDNKSNDDSSDDSDDDESSSSSSDDDDDDDDNSDDDDGDEQGNGNDVSNNNSINKDGLSDYELLRLERIKRNQARLAQLGLLNNAATKLKKFSSSTTGGDGRGRPKKQRVLKPPEEMARRSQPKRSAKSNPLTFQQLSGATFDVRQMRLPSDDVLQRRSQKATKEMYSRRYRCGQCLGCFRDDDCGTCVYCVDRQQDMPKSKRRCIFRMCLRRLVVVDDDKDVKPAAAAATTSMDIDKDDNENFKLKAKKKKKKVSMIAECIKPNRLKKRILLPMPSISRSDDSNTAATAVGGTAHVAQGENNNNNFSYFPPPRNVEKPIGPRHIIDRVARNTLHELMIPVDEALRGLGWDIIRHSRKKHYLPTGEDWTTRTKRINTVRLLMDFLKTDDEWKDNEVVKATLATFFAAVEEEAVPEPEPDPVVIEEQPKIEEESTTATDSAANNPAVETSENKNDGGGTVKTDLVVSEEPMAVPPGVSDKKEEPSSSTEEPALPTSIVSQENGAVNTDAAMDEEKEAKQALETLPTTTNPENENKAEEKPATTTADVNPDPNEKMLTPPTTTDPENDNEIEKLPDGTTDEEANPASIVEKVDAECENDVAMTDSGATSEEPRADELPPHAKADIETSATLTLSQTAPKTDVVDKNNQPRPKHLMVKPKRPMSAYNIFFKDERARILADIPHEKVEDGEKEGSEDADKVGMKQYRPHGKIAFEDLAKAIGQRWKEVSPEEHELYRKRAEEEMTKYRKEKEAWEKQQVEIAKEACEQKQGQPPQHVDVATAGEANDGAPSADIDTNSSNDLCCACSKGRDLIYCDACKKGYHSNCHSRPIREIPLGDWICSECKPKRPPKTPREKREKVAKNVKLFEGDHDDDCYICFNGGELVCCDFCPKAFHCGCHIPPLPFIPSGVWKCCECSALERTKKSRCGECEACTRDDCGKCVYCLDKPKFGGPGTKKQVCVKRQCPYPRFAPPASATTVAGEITTVSQYKKSSTKKRSRDSTGGSSVAPPKTKRPKLDGEEKKQEEPPLPPQPDPQNYPPLIFPEDRELAADYLYLTFEQMRLTNMTEADKVGCYKNQEVGFTGLACKHCVGRAGSGRYFPPSETSLSQTTTTQTIMNHLRYCRYCPIEIKENLEIMIRARKGPDGKAAKNSKHGGRKVFFKKLWSRIQDSNKDGVANEEQKQLEHDKAEPVKVKVKEVDESGDDGPVVFKFRLSTVNSAYMDSDSIGIRKHIKNALKDPDNSKTQDKACELLRKYTTTPDNVKKVVLFGGVEMICKAMREHSDKSVVQAEACCTLAEMLWVYPGASLKLANAGAIDLVISAINRHPSNIKVQQMGCAAFRALSYDGSSVEHITDTAVSAVIFSMECNPTKLAVQKEGCYFLQNMLVYSTHNAIAISKSQVVPIVMSGMSNENFDDEFRQSACGLIANLALDDEAKAAIGKFGVIHCLIATLNVSNDIEVKQSACSALKHLALESSENQAKVFQAGGLEAAFGAIKSFPDDPVLLVAAFGLMKELCIHDEEAARIIMGKGGEKVILRAMKQNPDLPRLQVEACGVIGYLIYSKRDASAPKLAKAIIAAMKNHCDSAVVQIEACDALLELSQVPAVCKILKDKNIQKLLSRAKSHFPSCESDVDDIIATCSKE